MFSVSEIIGFEPVEGICLFSEKNTCDLHSACYETVPGFRILLREMFSNSICPRLMETCDKSAVVQVSALLGTRKQV